MANIKFISGIKELGEALQKFPVKIERNVLRGAIRAGVKEIALQARANAPERTGTLKKSIKYGAGVRGGLVKGRARTGVPYGHLVEFGTKAHLIVAKPGGYMRIGGRLVKSVMHPGARAKPFMTPAFDSRKGAAVRAVGDYIRRRLATKYGIDIPSPFEDGDFGPEGW